MSKVIPFTGDFVPGAQIVQEADITVERLRSLLETAVIDLEVDKEGDLYLSGGVDFPIWISVVPESKMIELSTLIRNASQDDAAVALRLNTLNMKFILGQYCLVDGAIYSRHVISFDGGLLPRQFVKMVRRFAGSFREAVEEVGDLLTGEGSADSPQRVE
jgi:hypothetical protein